MKRILKKFSLMFIMVLAIALGSFTCAFAADSTYTDNLIPKMTSNTAPSGVANASSYYSGYPSYNAFQRTFYDAGGSYWMASSNAVPQWISYKFDTPKNICKYTIKYINYQTDLTRAPRDWQFQGSNDNQNWVTLDSQSGMIFSAGEKKTFTFSNSTSYSSYRIYITSINGSTSYGAVIDEIEMMEKVQSNAISLDKSSMNLNVGDSQQLTATTTPAGAQVTWTSSDPSIATVDSAGKVTGVKEGQATITATMSDGSNLSSSCTVAVAKKEESISLNKSTTDLTTGASETLIATTTPSAVNVTWNSSNTSVATVDSTGKVTAIGAGTAIITATTMDGSNLSASCTVNVTAGNGGNTGGTPGDGTSTIVNIAHAKGDNTNNAGGEVSIIFNGLPDTTLSVVKTADVKSVYVGDAFTYTVVVTNTGTKTAKAVVINDSAPNHIDFTVDGVTTTQGSIDPSSTSKNIIVNVGDIPPAGTVTIKIPATVIE